MDEEAGTELDIPEYVLPLFFTNKTQEIFSCKVDEQVTEDNPFKIILKEQILKDFKDRAAISDFHPAKKVVENYPSDEILIVYDAAFKYGQNFYLVTDDEKKNILLNPPPEEDGEEDTAVEELVEVRIGLRTPKPWISLGSEHEVSDEIVVEASEKLKFHITREREKFGCPIYFTDRNEEEARDIIIDCLSFEEDGNSVESKEMDKAVQHVAVISDSASQTVWPCPKNANVQYTSRYNPNKENDRVMNSRDILEFFEEVIPRFELALGQNDTLDLFTNDYLQLGEEDSAFGSKSDNHLKEYQSFTDLQFSKNKTISDIQWHPAIKGLVAVSCMEQMSFYDRIDHSSQCLMTPSLILIWSFADPIHPLLLLEAPDDIICFKFNPSDPNTICAGCINGQIVLWDLTEYSDHLKNHRTHGQGSQLNQNVSNLPSFLNTKSQETSPMLRYAAVSSIEHSHRMAITDIQWIPDHIEIGRMGVVVENKLGFCSQIISCASDGTVLFWDTKSSKSSSMSGSKATESDPSSPFHHLDLTWKPILKVTVHRLRGSGDLSPVKFSIAEVQREIKPEGRPMDKSTIEEEENNSVQTSGLAFKKKDEGKVLDHVSTKFYVGTEDGELVYLDWKPTKDIDTGKIVSSRPEFCLDAHDSEIYCLHKSPFMSSVFLTVGGWTFSIWKEGVTTGPLLQSFAHECKLTCGYWSPSRAGVFFIGKADGCIDVWDLMDKSHEAFLTQSISPSPIMSVFPYQISSKQQLLAAGDEVGTLHVVEVPWNLRHSSSNEHSIVENYLEREANRLQYVEERKTMRTKDSKSDTENANEQAIELDEEWEEKAKLQFLDYLEMEKRILEDLGLAKQDEE